MLPITSVLHPTDFSERAEAAFHIAHSLARDYAAKLYLLHVVPYSSFGALEGAANDAPEQERVAKEMLHKLAAQAPGVPVETAVVLGQAAEDTVAFADTHKIDVIVLGTHGHTGLSRLLMGSVAEHILRHAPCPVLTVRKPFPRAAS